MIVIESWPLVPLIVADRGAGDRADRLDVVVADAARVGAAGDDEAAFIVLRPGVEGHGPAAGDEVQRIARQAADRVAAIDEDGLRRA